MGVIPPTSILPRKGGRRLTGPVFAAITGFDEAKHCL